MVKIDANFNHPSQNSQEVLSTIFLSIGALTLVISLILGIKWKRFRYRMTFQNTPGENLITIRRHSTTTTIRENCTEGRYRHATTEELITNDNEIQPTLRNTTAYNVKLESSDRESIFRWPFKNKMKVSSSNFIIDENRVLDIDDESVHRRERDSMLAEKNERLRRSIYERLNSTTSMPDLVNDSQAGTYQQKADESFLVIQKGVESELDESAHYQVVDEIHDTKIVETVPVRIKESPVSAPTFELCVKPKESHEKITKTGNENETIQNSTPPKPPVRRRSKASDLTPPKDKKEVQEIQNIPPPVKPRKRISHLTVKIDESRRQNEGLATNEATLPKKHEATINKEAGLSKELEGLINNEATLPREHETSVNNEATTPKEQEALIPDIVDSNQALETILSPPIEYKDTSLNANSVSSEQTKALSPIISTETLTFEEDSSSMITIEISKHEQDSSMAKDAVDSTEILMDTPVYTVDPVHAYDPVFPADPDPPTENQGSSLPQESNSTTTKYPAPREPPSYIQSQTIFQDEVLSIKSEIATPKSILKTQKDTSQQPKSTVQFMNVPDSSSEDDDDHLYEDNNDIWSKIEMHRNQLMMNHEFNRVYISSRSGDSPPPLPKTPPPTADIQERNFVFA
ncbi:neurofilament heavy polypeptide-like [Chironomus tepperi]|uniref:neurofilament heavy polypeptide-like n=1 Tax=Chironomus tepperi TaxID=113505 RepID=UPI00391F4458